MHPRRRTSLARQQSRRALSVVSLGVAGALALGACNDSSTHTSVAASPGEVTPSAVTTAGVATAASDSTRPRAATTPAASKGPNATRAPNKLGRIPVLEYHLLGGGESRWKVDTAHFRRTLQLMYDRGYRPINIADMLDRKIDLPAGMSPVVLVFDDASPSQFSYIERDGKLEVDPNSAVGILLDFNKQHPDWKKKAVFCMLPAAAAGHAFFGEKNIDGQKSEWRFKKVRFLADQGFELCNHTLWHANLGKYPDAFVQQQIARGQMAIDSAVPGYKVRTFGLPLGVWPKNRPLAWAGSWVDPKTGKTVRYDYEAVLEVAGGPTRSPYDPQFNPHSIARVEAFGQEVEKMLDRLDASGMRYVSDGASPAVARK